jgi:hypothetical protein
MGRREEFPISLQMAAAMACRRLAAGRRADPVALDAAAEALARILTVYQEVGGRLLELPLEDRVLGTFEGGAARFSVAGAVYRRLFVRRDELDLALAALVGGSDVGPALPEEQHPGKERAAGE